MEILIAVFGTLFLAGLFSGSMFLIFYVIPERVEDAVERQYPVKVPGWKTRLSEHPPFDATVDDFAYMNERLVHHAMKAKGYSKKKAVEKVGNARISFVLGAGGKRRVPDPYNPNGFRAGWHNGNEIHIVWIPGDTLDIVAAAHEFGHELHEIEGVTDRGHLDLSMWGGVVDEKDRGPFGPFGDVGDIINGVVFATKKDLALFREDGTRA